MVGKLLFYGTDGVTAGWHDAPLCTAHRAILALWREEQESLKVIDEELARSMQAELMKGSGWFCPNFECLLMNVDIKVFVCRHCGKERPKPKIPDVATVSDKVAMEMVTLVNAVESDGSVINVAFAKVRTSLCFVLC